MYVGANYCMSVCMYAGRCVSYVSICMYACISFAVCACVSLSIFVGEVPAGAALHPPPHPLPHSAGVALRHVDPDVGATVSMLSLLLPGNVVVADVTISPRTIIQAACAIAWTQ